MIYEFIGEIVTEEALEKRISDEVEIASFNSLALACYVLEFNLNINSTFDTFNNNNINKFEDWAIDIIENRIYEDFQPADFNDYEYNSKEELEENASDSTSWKMDWSSELFKLM